MQKILYLDDKFISKVKFIWFAFLEDFEKRNTNLNTVVFLPKQELSDNILKEYFKQNKKKSSIQKMNYEDIFFENENKQKINLEQIDHNEKDFYNKSKSPFVRTRRKTSRLKTIEKMKMPFNKKSSIKDHILHRLKDIEKLISKNKKEEFFSKYNELILEKEIYQNINFEYIIKFYCLSLYKLSNKNSKVKFDEFILNKSKKILNINLKKIKSLYSYTKSLFLLLVFLYKFYNYNFSARLNLKQMMINIQDHQIKKYLNNNITNYLLSKLENLEILISIKDVFNILNNKEILIDINFLLSIILFTLHSINVPINLNDIFFLLEKKVYLSSYIKNLFHNFKNQIGFSRLPNLNKIKNNYFLINKKNLSLNNDSFLKLKTDFVINLIYVILSKNYLLIYFDFFRKFLKSISFDLIHAFFSNAKDNIFYLQNQIITSFFLIFAFETFSMLNDTQKDFEYLHKKVFALINPNNFKLSSKSIFGTQVLKKVNLKLYTTDNIYFVSENELNFFLKNDDIHLITKEELSNTIEFKTTKKLKNIKRPQNIIIKDYFRFYYCFSYKKIQYKDFLVFFGFHFFFQNYFSFDINKKTYFLVF